MRKFFALLIAGILFLPILISAKQVGLSDARHAALNCYYEKVNRHQNVPFDRLSVSEAFTLDRQGMPLAYAINIAGGGFVLMSADDNAYPILGYSTEGSYQSNNLPENFGYWMEHYLDQIAQVKEQGLQASAEISSEWTRLLTSSPGQLNPEKGAKDVESLLMMTWDQGKYYNTLCPADPTATSSDGHALTGCVATAMAQVMYYYRYPAVGIGSNGYYANNSSQGYGNYGYLFVDFTQGHYDYNAMMNNLTFGNLEVAELMYHAGVSVDMKYGPDKSGAMASDVPIALKNNFGYIASTSYIEKISYGQSAWEQIIRDNLDLKKPLIYSGSGSGGGHAWVCDGYQGTSFFHFNWGWSGSYNGYFYLNDLNPGNNGPFNNTQGMTRNIYPGSGYPYNCTGDQTLIGNYGTFEDGSGPSEYQPNLNCSWVIAPNDSVTKFKITVNDCHTEAGQDVLTIYNGPTTSDPVLGVFSGDTASSAMQTTANRILVTFSTSGSTSGKGWQVQYVPIFPVYCTSSNTITAPEGDISDGSGSHNYNNNTVCTWIISPANATSVILDFTSMDLADENDYVKVYDYGTSAVLGKFTGDTLPQDLTAGSGGMYIEFKTGHSYNAGGFVAHYAAGNLGTGNEDVFRSLFVYPNPAKDQLNVRFNSELKQNITLNLLSPAGTLVHSENLANFNGEFNQKIDVSMLPKGLYFLQLKGDKGTWNSKVVIE